MSYTAVKNYHSNNAIHNGLKYTSNPNKTNIENAAGGNGEKAFSGNTDMYTGEIEGNVDTQLRNAFVYSSNANKTNIGVDGDIDLLVSGHNCKPDLAETDFGLCRDRYYAKGHKEKCDYATSKRIMRAKLDINNNPILDTNGDMVYDSHSPILKDKDGKVVHQFYQKQKEARTAYMWVISFPGVKELGYELDPRLVHEIGREFCKEYLGDYACTISTHVNTEHYHNHIMQCAYSLDGTHKYKDDMESLKKARDLIDEISHKYDIPIILSPKTERGVNWFEWKSRRDGDSWKEQMRQDIKNTLSISKSFDEYKRLMRESGYTLRETDKHITYYMPCANKDDVEYRCRDTKLNISADNFDYSKENIENVLDGKEIDKGKQKQNYHIIDPSKKEMVRQHANHIYVSKHTVSGRQRSAIEIIIIKAIELISLLKDKFADSTSKSESPVYKPSQWKLQQMKDTLSIVQNLGIEDKEQLDQMTNKAGTILSQLKHQYEEQNAVYKPEKDVLNKIEETIDLINTLKQKDITPDKLSLYTYDKKDIQKHKAELMPATPAQKRELNLEISKSPIYRVTCKYENLTYLDVQNIIEFLKRKTTIKPDVLTDISEHSQERTMAKIDTILQNRIAGLKNKYADKPLTDNQKCTIQKMFAGIDKTYSDRLEPFKDIKIDIDKLSYYDAYRIINFMDSSNPFSTPVANAKQMAALNTLVEKNGDALNREDITLSEIKDIETYYQSGEKTAIPNVLQKDIKPGTEKEITAVQELLSYRGESSTIPLNKLSGKDLFKLNTYLLFKNDVPEIFTRTPEKEHLLQDMFFDNRFAEYPISDLEQIDHLRTLLNDLGSIGITADNIFSAKTDYESALDIRDKTETKLEQVRIEYKNLKRLSYNIQLAGNKKFTNGPLFDEPDIKVLDTDSIKAEDEQKKEVEREKEYEQPSLQQVDIQSIKLWNTPDKYFDNLSK